MRTTLVIDDDVYEAARLAAFRERSSLGAVISAWARRGSSDPSPVTGERELGFWRGQIAMSDDFDETPADVLNALTSPV